MVKAATAERFERERAGTLGPEVGRRIRAARQERKMTLAQLGGEDLSRSFLSLVESGKSRISLRALAIVAQRLDLPISYFLDEESSPAAVAELLLDYAEAELEKRKPEECLHRLEQIDVPAGLRVRALTLRGRTLVAAGRPRDAVAPLREALELSRSGPDQQRDVELLYQLGRALYALANFDEALVYFREARERLPLESQDTVLAGNITVCLGHIAYVRGDVDGALEHYARARELFGTFGDLSSLASVYSSLSLSYYRKGDMASALRYSRLSLSAYEAQRDLRQAARELNNMAVAYLELGDHEHALECAQDAVDRAHGVHASDVEALGRSTLARIYLDAEDLGHAVQEAEMVDHLLGAEHTLAQTGAWIVLADAAERSRDHARADELYQRALHVIEENGWHGAYADKALAYSLLLQRRGETEKALKYAISAAQGRSAVAQ